MTLIQRDLNHIWHPCSQMKDFEQNPPLVVEHASGSYLYTSQGPVIDAISSWWCKSLGHQHPTVVAAVQKQLQHFEHVIGANTTHPNLVEFAEHLYRLTGKQHVQFASDGSCAVEIAIKLALHAAQLRGQPERNTLIAFEHSYHGETLATLSISDLGRYKQPYTQFNLPCFFIRPLPYVANLNDPLWSDCEVAWQSIQPQLNAVKGTACAIIFEPIVQGAGGMRCYSANFLQRLAAWARANDIYIIADEIMTGLGRTGEWLACRHANIEPDMICLSKGLTSGSLPLSCTLIDHSIYELFYDDYEKNKSFLHSHTYACNALAISAALATLQVMEEENINQQARALGECMNHYFHHIAKQTGKLVNVRGIGGLIAADLVEHPTLHRVGYHVGQTAIHYGALLRPLGNTLYWLPPLITTSETIEKLAEATLRTINHVYGS